MTNMNPQKMTKKFNEMTDTGLKEKKHECHTHEKCKPVQGRSSNKKKVEIDNVSQRYMYQSKF